MVDLLTLARQAHNEQDWATADAQYGAVASEQLNAADLAAYAEAVWWLGRAEDNLRLEAAAYEAFVAESRPESAALAAMRLGIFHMGRGDEPQAMGWISRARRLLDAIPECLAQGLLLHVTGVELNLHAGQPAAAVEAARQLQALGARIDEPDLVCLGLNSEGRALIRAGQVVDGLSLLDESMVTVLDGRRGAFTSGTLYCHTIEACHEIGDLRRVTRWTDLTEEWLASLPSVGVFGGLCAVHRAQLHLVRGAWVEAERAALAVAGLDAMRIDYAAEAWYLVGEARRLRGDPSAVQAYDNAHARGRDPQPGRARMLSEQGDADGAVAALLAALAAVGTDPLRRAPLCAAIVDIAVEAGRLADARDAASELERTAATFGTSGLEAMAAGARGAQVLAEGDAESALPVLRDACRRWLELDAAYEAANICVLLSDAYRALGDAASAAAEAARAQATYQRLGVRRPQDDLPGGLTRRECEVLALIADGDSNRDIGEKLFISDRTVARHLTNIFHKIGVTSRTAAARYAIDHGIAPTH